MKFLLGGIPENADFHPEQGGWQRLREPGPVVMQILGLPIGLGVVIVLGLAVAWLGMLDFEHVHPAVMLLVLVGMIPLHECVHLLAHPRMGRSPHSIVGFWPATLLFFAHYDHQLSRNRFVLILAAPFLVVSVMPLFVCGLAGWRWGWVALLSMWNGLCAYGDLFGVLLVIWQVPRRALVRNRGYWTWWILREDLAAQNTPARDEPPPEEP